MSVTSPCRDCIDFESIYPCKNQNVRERRAIFSHLNGNTFESELVAASKFKCHRMCHKYEEIRL